MFSKEYNVVKPDEIPYDEALRWCVGVDYGTSNSTAFLLLMKTYTGEIYVCKEYYFEGRKEAQEHNDYSAQKTDLEFAEDMIEFLGDNYHITEVPFNKMDIVLDPAAISFKIQLKRSGLKPKNADNAVIDGIRTVATLFGSRQLKVSSECKNLLREIQTYVWDEAAQLKGGHQRRLIWKHSK